MTHLVAFLSLVLVASPQQPPAPGLQEQPQQPDYVLRLSIGEGTDKKSTEISFGNADIAKDGTLTKSAPAREGLPALQLTKLLRSAKVVREVEASEKGSPAIEIVVSGGRRPSSHWMLADSRNMRLDVNPSSRSFHPIAGPGSTPTYRA